jgi:hypothetical protein
VGRALLTGLLGALLATAAVALGPSALLLPGCALLVLALASAAWALLAGRGRLERRLGATRASLFRRLSGASLGIHWPPKPCNRRHGAVPTDSRQSRAFRAAG